MTPPPPTSDKDVIRCIDVEDGSITYISRHEYDCAHKLFRDACKKGSQLHLSWVEGLNKLAMQYQTLGMWVWVGIATKDHETALIQRGNIIDPPPKFRSLSSLPSASTAGAPLPLPSPMPFLRHSPSPAPASPSSPSSSPTLPAPPRGSLFPPPPKVHTRGGKLDVTPIGILGGHEDSRSILPNLSSSTASRDTVKIKRTNGSAVDGLVLTRGLPGSPVEDGGRDLVGVTNNVQEDEDGDQDMERSISPPPPPPARDQDQETIPALSTTTITNIPRIKLTIPPVSLAGSPIKVQPTGRRHSRPTDQATAPLPPNNLKKKPILRGKDNGNVVGIDRDRIRRSETPAMRSIQAKTRKASRTTAATTVTPVPETPDSVKPSDRTGAPAKSGTGTAHMDGEEHDDEDTNEDDDRVQDENDDHADQGDDIDMGFHDQSHDIGDDDDDDDDDHSNIGGEERNKSTYRNYGVDGGGGGREVIAGDVDSDQDEDEEEDEAGDEAGEEDDNHSLNANKELPVKRRRSTALTLHDGKRGRVRGSSTATTPVSEMGLMSVRQTSSLANDTPLVKFEYSAHLTSHTSPLGSHRLFTPQPPRLIPLRLSADKISGYLPSHPCTFCGQSGVECYVSKEQGWSCRPCTIKGKKNCSLALEEAEGIKIKMKNILDMQNKSQQTFLDFIKRLRWMANKMVNQEGAASFLSAIGFAEEELSMAKSELDLAIDDGFGYFANKFRVPLYQQPAASAPKRSKKSTLAALRETEEEEEDDVDDVTSVIPGGIVAFPGIN